MTAVQTSWDVITRGALRDEAALVAELIAGAGMDAASETPRCVRGRR